MARPRQGLRDAVLRKAIIEAMAKGQGVNQTAQLLKCSPNTVTSVRNAVEASPESFLAQQRDWATDMLARLKSVSSKALDKLDYSLDQRDVHTPIQLSVTLDKLMNQHKSLSENLIDSIKPADTGSGIQGMADKLASLTQVNINISAADAKPLVDKALDIIKPDADRQD